MQQPNSNSLADQQLADLRARLRDIRTATNHSVRECPDCGEDMEQKWLVLDEDTESERDELMWICSECGYEEET